MRYIVFGLVLVSSIIVCNVTDSMTKDSVNYCGVWNLKAIRASDVVSVVYEKANYDGKNGYIIIDKQRAGDVRYVRTQFYGLIITSEIVENSNVTIDVKPMDPNYKPEGKNSIVLHWVNSDEIWFENKLSPKTSKMVELQNQWIKFGKNNIYERARISN